MKIHNNLEEAKAACDAYVKAVSETSERLGAYETCEDSFAAIYVQAKYRDERGIICTFTA